MTLHAKILMAGAACAALAGLAAVPTLPKGGRMPPLSVDWARAKDNPAERLDISWRGSLSFPSGRPGSWVQRRLEERFNIGLKPLFMDVNAYRVRLPLLHASGEVPDVSWDGDPIQLRRSIREGYATELPYDVIKRWAPVYVRNLNRIGKEAWLYSRFGGRNYGLPTFGAGGIYSYPTVWRMDWLREAGFARPPETLDEMHAAFKAFKKRGPGIYGMCPMTDWPVGFMEIFAAFGVLPQDFMIRGGRIVWGGVQPESKEALALLRQWFAEGLIDPDFATASSTLSSEGSPLERKFRRGQTGCYFGWATYNDFDARNPSSRLSSMRRTLGPGVELAPGKPLAGPDGRRHARVWGGAAHVIWFGPGAARHPAKIIRVLRMLESLQKDRAAFLESRLGQRGVEWDWNPERGVFLLPPYSEAGQAERSVIDIEIEGAFGFFSPSSLPLEETAGLLPRGAAEFRRLYANPKWSLGNALGKSDVVPSAGALLEDLRQLQIAAYVRIIRGDLPLDAFDRFVREWSSRGGARLTSEAAAAYVDAQAVYREAGAAP